MVSYLDLKLLAVSTEELERRRALVRLKFSSVISSPERPLSDKSAVAIREWLSDMGGLGHELGSCSLAHRSQCELS